MTTTTKAMTSSTDPRRVEYLPLADLKRNPQNPKGHDLGTIETSIGRFGVLDLMVLDERTGQLVSGHGRLETLTAMQVAGESPPDGITIDDRGRWLAPVVTGWASRSDTEAAAALIALNRSTELGGWLDEPLLALLDDLAQTDALDGVGYGDAEIAALRGRLETLAHPKPSPWDDRPVRELPESTECQVGDRWQLGPHTLTCGDSRDPAVWADAGAGDVLLTDPPYGVAYSGGGGLEREPLAGDGSADEALALMAAVCDVVPLRPGGLVYVFTAPGEAGVQMQAELVSRGWLRWVLVWVKDRATFTRADYHTQHEPIGYGWVPGGPHAPVVDRTKTTVLRHDKPQVSAGHPSMKPVPLLRELLANHALPAGSLVLEPFAGSGSTLVAAHEEGLRCWAVETDPRYCQVILDRWRDGTGLEPVLVSERWRKPDLAITSPG